VLLTVCCVVFGGVNSLRSGPALAVQARTAESSLGVNCQSENKKFKAYVRELEKLT
jgi:hypothetical protein